MVGALLPPPEKPPREVLGSQPLLKGGWGGGLWWGQGRLLLHQLGRMRVLPHRHTLARPPELDPGLQPQKQPLAETGRQRGLPSLLPPPRGPCSLSALPPAVQHPPLRPEGLSIPGSLGKLLPLSPGRPRLPAPSAGSCPGSLSRVE